MTSGSHFFSALDSNIFNTSVLQYRTTTSMFSVMLIASAASSLALLSVSCAHSQARAYHQRRGRMRD
jgi:hypothetical protein